MEHNGSKITKINNDPFLWKNNKFNCPAFLKKYICKHIVGICLRLKLCKAPPAAKDVSCGLKHKRGRPEKAKKALLVQ